MKKRKVLIILSMICVIVIACFWLIASLFGRVTSLSKEKEKEYLDILTLAQKYNITEFETYYNSIYPPDLVQKLKECELNEISLVYPDSVIFFAKNT